MAVTNSMSASYPILGWTSFVIQGWSLGPHFCYSIQSHQLHLNANQTLATSLLLLFFSYDHLVWRRQIDWKIKLNAWLVLKAFASSMGTWHLIFPFLLFLFSDFLIQTRSKIPIRGRDFSVYSTHESVHYVLLQEDEQWKIYHLFAYIMSCGVANAV